MKRLAFLILVLACTSMSAFAADVPPGDVFGGFSIDHVSSNNHQVTFTGWQANAAFDVHKMISVVADFAGEYKRDEDGQVQFLFGPRVSKRMNSVTYFGEALFGGDRIDGENLFAMGYGGGLNVQAGKITIRVIQFDWIPIRAGDNQPWIKNNTRFGFGVVIPFGIRK